VEGLCKGLWQSANFGRLHLVDRILAQRYGLNKFLVRASLMLQQFINKKEIFKRRKKFLNAIHVKFHLKEKIW
jgi:hypothetical protein